MRNVSDYPRNGIRPVDRFDRVEARDLKNRCDPHKTERARAEERHDHRHHIITDTADRADDDVHEAIERIGNANDPDAHHTRLDNRARVGINR